MFRSSFHPPQRQQYCQYLPSILHEPSPPPPPPQQGEATTSPIPPGNVQAVAWCPAILGPGAIQMLQAPMPCIPITGVGMPAGTAAAYHNMSSFPHYQPATPMSSPPPPPPPIVPQRATAHRPVPQFRQARRASRQQQQRQEYHHPGLANFFEPGDESPPSFHGEDLASDDFEEASVNVVRQVARGIILSGGIHFREDDVNAKFSLLVPRNINIQDLSISVEHNEIIISNNKTSNSSNDEINENDNHREHELSYVRVIPLGKGAGLLDAPRVKARFDSSTRLMMIVAPKLKRPDPINVPITVINGEAARDVEPRPAGMAAAPGNNVSLSSSNMIVEEETDGTIHKDQMSKKETP